MLLPWRTAVIRAIENETDNTKRFYFNVPELEVFDFEPGQFVTLDLPIHEQKNKRWRSYSIASSPDGTNGFELVIVKMEGGAGTSWLWENATVGTEILYRGPQGKFVLPREITTDLYFICTGTGIAPFRSMINHIKNHGIPTKDIYLVFGTRLYKDALYYHELRELGEEMDNFHFLPTFSREEAGNDLLLRTGYVHTVYEEMLNHSIRARQAEGETGLPPAKFFLCGWKMMIDDAKEKLQALGYTRHDIHLELYG